MSMLTVMIATEGADQGDRLNQASDPCINRMFQAASLDERLVTGNTRNDFVLYFSASRC